MSNPGPIPGWGAGGAETTGGAADPARRSIADRLAESWRLYRAHWRPLLGIAVLVQGTIGLPLAALSVGSVIQSLRLLSGDLPFPRTGAAYAVAFGPFHDVILDYALLGLGLGLVTLGLLVTYAATSLLLLDPPGESPDPVEVLRLTFRRGRPIVLAGIAVGLGYGALYWVQGLTLARQSLYTPPYRSDGMALAAIAFLSVLVFVIEIVAIYLMIRWVAAVPAVAVEGRSLGAALARSSDLTRGRRLSVAAVFFVASFLVAIVFALIEFLPALLFGPQLGWDSPVLLGLLALITLIAQIAATPFLTTLLTVLFRDLRAAGPRPRLDPVDVPRGWGTGG
jgi:hypothetical protein